LSSSGPEDLIAGFFKYCKPLQIEQILEGSVLVPTNDLRLQKHISDASLAAIVNRHVRHTWHELDFNESLTFRRALANYLVLERERAGLRQNEVARSLNLTAGRVNHLELASTNTTIDSIGRYLSIVRRTGPSEHVSLRELVADNVRWLRTSRNVTQAELSAAIGKSATYIGRLESKTSAFSVDQVGLIADALGVDPFLLLSDFRIRPNRGKGIAWNVRGLFTLSPRRPLFSRWARFRVFDA